jgi:hypothetical protein
MHERALRGYDIALGPYHVTTLSMAHNLGVCFLELGKPNEAMIHLSRAYDGRMKHFGKEHPDSLLSALAIAKTLHKQSAWRHK